MKALLTFFTLSSMALLVASCGGGGSGGGDSAFSAPNGDLNFSGGNQALNDESARAGLMERYASNYKFAKDKDGNSRIVTNSKTQYASGDQYAGTKSYKRGKYQKKEYNSKTWKGARDYQRSAYAQKTRAAERLTRDSGYGSQNARETGSLSRAGDKNYGTNGYKTSQARETNQAARNASGSNYQVERKRNSFDAPIVGDSKEAARRTITETREALGRKEGE